VASLKRALEEETALREATLQEMRHKHTQEQTSINEQLENIKKVKLALDKQKQTLEAENADLATELRNVNQSRQENDRRRKQAEQQFNEVQVRKIIIKII
jgi:myosin protein heavy chain